jgi:hypothetical protein
MRCWAFAKNGDGCGRVSREIGGMVGRREGREDEQLEKAVSEGEVGQRLGRLRTDIKDVRAGFEERLEVLNGAGIDKREKKKGRFSCGKMKGRRRAHCACM